ncbi:hypothetical protein B0T20DRAFT_399387 [Sordaria brevicollis]|uniref:Uncharacterized protein n=1 Tax=Sordaria brevicollis TaxID=83679 RepID=A0AAE0PN19_SORBR|nr:hypothetical protein B0T20DRAFT_399387 [Sordaria brevicollis]
MSKRSQNSSHRCTCQRSTSTSTSSGLWNASSSTAGPFSGSVNSGQSQDLSQAITGTGTGTTDTGTQLSVFSNNSNSTNGQNQASDGFQTPISPPRPTTQIEYRTRESPQDKSGNSMIKNLNVYNPNITIQMTPSTFSKFDKLFIPKQSGGGFGGNGSSN